MQWNSSMEHLFLPYMYLKLQGSIFSSGNVVCELLDLKLSPDTGRIILRKAPEFSGRLHSWCAEGHYFIKLQDRIKG